MDSVTTVVLAFGCVLVGTALGYLAALSVKAGEVRALAEEKAGALREAARIPALEARIGQLSAENADFRAAVAEVRTAATSEKEKNVWLAAAESRLREAFQALSSEALRNNSEQFTARTKEQLVAPLEKSLKMLDEQVRELERKREGAYAGLDQQLGRLREAYDQLRHTTSSLSTALTSSSGARGEWGEVQLRRIVELAGMTRHVDFEEQERTDAGKPDMIVHLPNRGTLAVDAKTTMKTFLDAMNAADPGERKARLQAHAGAVRLRIRELAAREYWKQYEHSPDFVVMFIPNDAFLRAAVEGDRDLLDYGFSQHVIIATPVTLLALFKSVAFAWQQQKLAENAREIAQEAHELCDRMNTFIGHLQKTGRALDSATKSYNESIGSLQSRIMPCARRLKELGATTSEIGSAEPVERQATLPAAEEDVKEHIQRC